MLPPKKSAHSVPAPNARIIYFTNPINYLRHLAWEGDMWIELSALTDASLLEASTSTLGESAVKTSIDMGMAIDLDLAPITTIN